jgi:hypothetical protein
VWNDFSQPWSAYPRSLLRRICCMANLLDRDLPLNKSDKKAQYSDVNNQET